MPLNININFNEVINFVVLSVIVKVIAEDWIGGILKWLGKILKRILKWLGKIILRLLRRIFIRTEADLIIYLHSFHKAAREGHQYPDVKACPDEKCSKIS